SVQDVYAAVPDLEKVDEKWSIVLKPFFVQLLDEQNAVFHTGLDGGEWIHPRNAIFDCLTEDIVRKQVVDVLFAANTHVVTVPMHYLEALAKFTSYQPQKITPKYVRTVLRRCPEAYEDLKAAQKLLLLHYVLKDQDFRDLINLKLLPLANGEFTYFSRSMESVFLANEECPRNLLPGLEHRLLADDLSGELMQTFTKVINEAEVKKAHASHSIVTLMEAFIDVSTSEAMSAATTLGVEILNDVSFIKCHVLSEMRNRRLKPEDVQKCMHYVFDNIQMLQRDDPQLLRHLTDIPFVTTKGGQVVSPNSVFDPTDGTLRKLFVGEDNHFPSGFYDTPESLVILRKMGMKTARDVSAHDILYTAAQIETMSNTLADDTRQKAETLLMFLASNCDLLQEEVNGKLLVDWLKDLAWVPVCTDMQEQLPIGLKVDAGDVFHTAGDVKSYDWACIVGSVVPIVRCRAKENISALFGWDRPPSLADVIRQFTQLVASYSYDAMADYTVIVRNTYDFLSKHSLDEVQAALEAAELREWVWHGEGFTTVERVLLQPPPLTLKPYVYALIPGLQRFHTLLSGCGVRRQCSSVVLVNVLHNMKAKYDKSDTEQVAGASDRGSGVAQATTKQQIQNGETTMYQAPDSVEEVESDHRLAIDILNHMKSLQLPASVLTRVLVPADVEGTVRLLPASDCAYCDVEWLRKGLDSMEFDETDGIVLTHHHLPTSTAAALGVPTLMSRMLHAEELAITSFGQGEPLTNTLRRMLEDYTDGLAIPKELVQNADDAGATEVHFMYDERTHDDARKYLFDEGMRECQGPALWCYSNSTFTDSDLDNIIRLGGAAKQMDATKIGRFGLGFNVVYNLTDVPSFVTGNVIVFFDPHTTHLGRSIHDKSKPGIKIDLRRNKTLLRKMSHQFQPYKGVFGCDMDAVSGPSWPATLFRFPLRTKLQAQRSDISGLHYDTAHMSQLLTLLADNAHNLLLFTQNVKKVSMWHLSSDTSPDNAVKIFSVSREIVTEIRDMYFHNTGDSKGKSEMTRSGTFLKAAVRYMNQWSEGSATHSPQTSTIVRIESYLNDRTTLLQTRPTASVKYWLSCLCMAEGRAIKLAQEMTKQGYVPAAAVAVRLLPADNGYVPVPQGEDDRDGGQVFNFLPLPVRSGLPVHINGMFAVHSNRRRLVETTADDTGSNLRAWNDALLEGGVVTAYTQMLHDLQPLVTAAAAAHDVPLYLIWPTVADTDSYFQPLVRIFYRFLTAQAATTPMIYIADNASVVTLDRVMFLLPDLVASPQLQLLVTSVFRQCVPDRTPVSVGGAVLSSFREAGCGGFIDTNTYDTKRFFSDIFFPNIQRFSAAERDPLVRFALQSKKVDSLLKQYPCVPVTPDGETLRTPQDMVHPGGIVAKLYLPTDGRFPHGDTFTGETCLRHLQELGMAFNEITWDNLIERLESVESVYQEDVAEGHNRIKCALEFLALKLMQQTGTLVSEKDAELQRMRNAAQERIVQIPFVPLLPRPRHSPLTWKNDEYGSTALLSPSVLYPREHLRLVSAVHPIADDQNMKKEVREFLGLVRKKPSPDDVMRQFDHMLGMQLLTLGDAEYDIFHSACSSIYAFLQHESTVRSKSESSDVACLVKSFLSSRPCILIQRQFQLPRKVTFNGGHGCQPYLHNLPTEMARRYKPLMKLLGVRDEFETTDYVEAIQELKKHEGDTELIKSKLQLAITLATLLCSYMELDKLKQQ
ncbi:Sacsin, partial [Lamellibrachia satsuma]